jgi:hypothetical protein
MEINCTNMSHHQYQNASFQWVCVTCKENKMELDPKVEARKAQWQTKDSGVREVFSTGMQRDTQSNKARYDLIWQPGLKRLAELMARGAEKYTSRNWEKAETQEELERFKASAYRHFMQWFMGEMDEDHMSGTIFNLFGAEFVKEKLNEKIKK